MPLASVLMPTYNGEKYITDAINSIIQQSFQDFELIIVDDGSDDGTPAIINQFLKKNGDKIRLAVHSRNQGISSATNTALANARGKYIFPMDHDDVALPKRLEASIRFLESSPHLSGCGALHVKMSKYDFINRLKIKQAELSARLVRPETVAASSLFGGKLFNPTVCFKKDALNLVSEYFKPDLLVGADNEFYARLQRAGARFSIIPLVLTLYRRHGENTSLLHPEGATEMRKNISKQAVLRLVPGANEKEIELHTKLAIRDKSIGPKVLPLLDAWFAKLLSTTTCEAEKQGLLEVLSENWVQACALAACTNFSAGWKSYYKQDELKQTLPSRLSFLYSYQKRKIRHILRNK